MKATHDYQPINCDFYDHIEIFALRKPWVQIEYLLEDKPAMTVAKISTTQTRDKEEYVILEGGMDIRMDHLTKITPLNPANGMLVNLLEKLNYNNWANRKMMSHLGPLEKCPNPVINKMSHIISVHDVWNRRILQQSKRFEIWKKIPVEDWPELFDHIHQQSREILLGSELGRGINYLNTNKEAHQSTVADIIYHVINHGTYHRGQISDILKAEGLEAIATDYILFSRIKA